MRLSYKQTAMSLFIFVFAGFTLISCAGVQKMDIKGDKDRTTGVTSVSPQGCTVDKFEVYSKSMDRYIKVAVTLPPEYKDNPEKKYPILYTLHGGGAPYDTYNEMSPLHRALKDKPMIVTCFDGDSSSQFIDSPYLQTNYLRGDKKKDINASKPVPVKSLFTTFFFDEFVPCVDKYYRVNPAERMITGFSMGGFGAFHYMLTAPKYFSSVSSMSGAFNSLVDNENKNIGWMAATMGSFSENRQRYEALDFYNRIKKCAEDKVQLPPVFLSCGNEDFLLGSNIKMRSFLEQNGYSCKYLESPGKHNWAFWVGNIEGIIDFHWKTLIKKGEKK